MDSAGAQSPGKSGTKGEKGYGSPSKDNGKSRGGGGYEDGGSVSQSPGKGGSRSGASYSSVTKGPSADNGHAKSRSFANYEDQNGKGKSIAESWRNPENYKKTRADDAEWRDWYDDEWDEDQGGHKGGPGMHSSGAQRGDRSKGKDGKGTPEHLSQSPPARSGWVARNSPGPLGAQVPPLPEPPRQPQQGMGMQQGLGFQNQSTMGGPPAGWDGPATAWLNGAAESVRWKVKACKNLGLLSRSLNPSVGSEADWQAVANLGARSIAQHCTQRASVVVGSFVEEAGIYELSGACASESGLGAAFRQLKLAPLFPQGTPQDEQNDQQCASLLAAIFGELMDAPLAE